MSHLTIANKNKQQKHPKVYFEQYLYNANEPAYDGTNDLPPDLEAELLGHSHNMRQHLRHIARRMRRNY